MIIDQPVVSGSFNLSGPATIIGSLTVSGSISTTGDITISGSVDSASFAESSSYSVTSSYTLNSEFIDGLDSTSFVYTSSYNTDSSSLSTRTTDLESTASVLTTASASFAVVSSSFSSTSQSMAGRITIVETSYATTGSNSFVGSQQITGSLTVSCAIIAQSLNVQQVTSSIVYSCGSNQFGCALSDVQQFTGSVNITGSLNVNGTSTVLGTGTTNFIPIFTGSSAIGNSNIEFSRVGNSYEYLIGTNNASDNTALLTLKSATESNLQFVNSATLFTEFKNSFGQVSLRLATPSIAGGNYIFFYDGSSVSNRRIYFQTEGNERVIINQDGTFKLNVINNATTDTDKFLVSDAGVVKYRTGAEVLSDIGGQSALTNPVTGTGTSGQVAYFNGTSSITSESNLFWDATNDRLGIGTATPSENLQIRSTNATGYFSGLSIENFISTNPGSGNGVSIDFRLNNSGNPSSVVGRIGALNTFFKDDVALTFFTTKSNALSEKMRLDSSGNLGLGVTPSAWLSGVGRTALQVGITSVSTNSVNDSFFGTNYYDDGTNNRYINTDFSLIYAQQNGNHIWYSAPSGTAGCAITFTQAMTLDASGRLSIGTTAANNDLNIYNTNNAGISLQNSYTGTTGSDGFYIGQLFQSTNFLFRQRENADIIFDTNSTERLRITSGGNVGIGTASPKNTLTVNGNIAKQTNTGFDGVIDNVFKYGTKNDLEGSGQNLDRWIGADATITAGAASSNKLIFKVYNGGQTGSPASIMTLLGDGNVGIGTTSPCQLLHLQTNFETSSGVGTAIQIESGGAGGDQAWIGVNKGTGNGLEFSVENRDIIFNTCATTPFGGSERMRITSTGIACFACQVCAVAFTTCAGGFSPSANATTLITTLPTANAMYLVSIQSELGSGGPIFGFITSRTNSDPAVTYIVCNGSCFTFQNNGFNICVKWCNSYSISASYSILRML